MNPHVTLIIYEKKNNKEFTFIDMLLTNEKFEESKKEKKRNTKIDKTIDAQNKIKNFSVLTRTS